MTPDEWKDSLAFLKQSMVDLHLNINALYVKVAQALEKLEKRKRKKRKKKK